MSFYVQAVVVCKSWPVATLELDGEYCCLIPR